MSEQQDKQNKHNNTTPTPTPTPTPATAAFQAALASAFAAELGELDRADIEAARERERRLREINALVQQEQQERANMYYSVSSVAPLDSIRESSALFLAESSGRLSSSPAPLDERLSELLEAGEQKYRVITARRLADGEAMRRRKEEERIANDELALRLSCARQADSEADKERQQRLDNEEEEEAKRVRARHTALGLAMETNTEEFQYHRHHGAPIVSPLTQRRWQGERAALQERIKQEEAKATALDQRRAEHKRAQQQLDLEESALAAERAQTAALVDRLVEAERRERVAEHEKGLDERKIEEARKIAVSVLLESHSEEYQTKKLIHLIGDIQVDPDEQHEWIEQARQRQDQAYAITAERSEQERRKKEARLEEEAEMKERHANMERVRALEAAEQNARVSSSSSAVEAARRSLSHAVANQVEQEVITKGSATGSLRPSRSNSRATSRRGSLSSPPPAPSLPQMLTAVKESLHHVDNAITERQQ